MKHKPILVFDLELNQPSNKIIEIGAVVGDYKTGVVLDSYQAFVTLDEIMHVSVSILTGITDKTLRELGIPLLEAYLGMEEIYRKYDCFAHSFTWGTGDLPLLKSQVSLLSPEWCLGQRYVDVKAVYQAWALHNNIKVRCGLAKALTVLGTTFHGTKHRALDDALNTFRAFVLLGQKYLPRIVK